MLLTRDILCLIVRCALTLCVGVVRCHRRRCPTPASVSMLRFDSCGHGERTGERGRWEWRGGRSGEDWLSIGSALSLRQYWREKEDWCGVSIRETHRIRTALVFGLQGCRVRGKVDGRDIIGGATKHEVHLAWGRNAVVLARGAESRPLHCPSVATGMAGCTFPRKACFEFLSKSKISIDSAPPSDGTTIVKSWSHVGSKSS